MKIWTIIQQYKSTIITTVAINDSVVIMNVK